MNEVKYKNTDRSGEVVVRSVYMMGNYSEP